MRLAAALEGNLEQIMKAETKAAARAVTRGLGRASSGLQRELRGQARRGNLGVGVEKAWSMTRYPRSRNSINAAALVFSKAQRIHDAFSADRTIRAQNGRWLVIPLDAAKARGWDKSQRMSKGNRPRRYTETQEAEQALGKLAFVRLAGDRALLVHRDGKGKPTPFFLLVKQVSLRKRFDINEPARKWHDRAPGYILREWGRATA